MDDEVEGCPACGTLLEVSPNLQLLFSTCCGWLLCTQCIQSKFRGQGGSMPCESCGKVIKSTDFAAESLQLQQLARLKHVRKQLLRTFNRTRRDFQEERAWNDYCEMLEEVVHDMTFGTPEQQAAARDKVHAYRQANLVQIERSAAQQASAARESANSERKEEPPEQQQQQQPQQQQQQQRMQLSFELPETAEGYKGWHERLKDQQQKVDAMADGDRKAKQRRNLEYTRAQVSRRGAAAGGFQQQHCVARMHEEAAAGLFFGL